MEKLVKNIATVYKGLQITKNEMEKPKNMDDVKELTLLSYDDMISYYTVPTLSHTIVSTESIKRSSKVYINMKKKYKEATMQKGDIVLPVGLKRPEPRIVNWNDLFETNYENYIYSNDLIIIRVLDTDKVKPEFLFHLLNTSINRAYLRGASCKNGRHRLTCEILENIKVYIPSAKEQIDALKDLEYANKIREKVEDYFIECATII